MPKQLSEPTERLHILLYKSDVQSLQRIYGKEPGVGPAIRIIVRQFLRQLDRRLEAVAEAKDNG